MIELSIAQIAAQIGISERTARRWITQGKLHTRPGRRPGSYTIDPNQLEQLTRHDPDELSALRAELHALTRRVDELERQGKQHRPARQQGSDQISEELAPGLVSAASFAQIHNIAPTTVQKAIETGRLLVMRGEWKQGRATIRAALDAEGRARFHALYHENPHFQACLECPHDQAES